MAAFTPGDLVISVYGNGDGSGTYNDNQASPIVLEQIDPTTGAVVAITGATNGTLTALGALILPQQSSTGANGAKESAVSGEYGSSSEGLLQLSADGHSLVIGGYGVNAAAYNAAESNGKNTYGNAALAQSTSVPNGTYAPVSRVAVDIDADGVVDSSTALLNVFNTNNIRSVATANGSSFYVSGQGVKGDTTQGVFVAQDGATGATGATAIDNSTDTREAEIYNKSLYVSRDSKQSTNPNIGSYGTEPTSATAATPLPGLSGEITLTGAQENSVNAGQVGKGVYLSPESYFFANATTLYVADSGQPKNGASGTTGLGDGGLQKWTLNKGTWTLDYTLATGLNLVPNTATSGTTGLIGLTGTVQGGVVQLYATNETLTDTGQTYLYSITDQLNATALPTSETFTPLVTAAPDTNIRGVAFAPQATAVASAPPPLTIALADDTGASNSDGVTSDDAVAGTAAANATVTFTDGTTTLGSTTADAATGAYTFNPAAGSNTNIGQGAQTITATETVNGSTAVANVALTYDTVAPAVAITSPGGTVATAGQTVAGTVTDANPGQTVSLFDNGSTTAFATAPLQGNGTFSAPVTLVQGANSITAQDTDLAGNVGTSAAVVYTYQPPAAAPPPSSGNPTPTTPTATPSPTSSPSPTPTTPPPTSSPSPSPTPTTSTTQNPDGSTTTTTKNPDGSSTSTTQEPNGTTVTAMQGANGLTTTTTQQPDGTTTTAMQNPNGTTTTTTSGGPGFDGKPYASTTDTYAADGTQLTEQRARNDGTTALIVDAPDQTLDVSDASFVYNQHQAGTAFVFQPGAALGVVHGFTAGGAGHDVLDLSGTDFHNSIAAVLRNTGDVNGSAFITDPVTGDAVRLAGVSTAELKPRDFTFHP